MNARPQTSLDTLSFDDGVLLARHAGGDDGALEKLLERNRPRVTAFVRGKVFDTLVVDDLVQETMLRAWVGVRSFAGESSFGTWLHAIARNVCIDHIRRSGRKREVPFDDAVSDAARRATAPMDRVPDARLRPADRAAADAQFRGELERALGGLPTGQRGLDPGDERGHVAGLIPPGHREAVQVEDLADQAGQGSRPLHRAMGVRRGRRGRLGEVGVHELHQLVHADRAQHAPANVD